MNAPLREKRHLCIGVLALQGNYIQHRETLLSLCYSKLHTHNRGDTANNTNAPSRDDASPYDISVRFLTQKSDLLENYSGLIIPGGESTTMLHLLHTQDMREVLIQKIKSGTPTLGTCAGAILFSKNLLNHPHTDVPPLGITDIAITRNAYGRQMSSFYAQVAFDHQCPDANPAFPDFIRGLFIRAPQIEYDSQHFSSNKVKVLATHQDSVVILKETTDTHNILLSSFHPEACADNTLHRYFIETMVFPSQT